MNMDKKKLSTAMKWLRYGFIVLGISVGMAGVILGNPVESWAWPFFAAFWAFMAKE